MSLMNVSFNYADDTNLLVPENIDMELTDKFLHCIYTASGS